MKSDYLENFKHVSGLYTIIKSNWNGNVIKNLF